MSSGKQKLLPETPSGIMIPSYYNSLSVGNNFDLPTADGIDPQSQESSFSDETKQVMARIRDLKAQPVPSKELFTNRGTLDELLFDARAKIKILVSEVSMHITKDWRERIFRQIDLLHDPDDWENEDYPISLQSFKTFLKWFFISNPSHPPGFGLTSAGNFIAAWSKKKDKLVLEFLPNDSIKWIVAKYYENEPERASGVTKNSRILTVLAPYNTDDWFSREKENS